MKMVELQTICKIIAGQSPPSNSYNNEGKGVPFFQGKTDFGDLYPKVRMWCTEPKKIALPNDILISVRAPVGPTNINKVKSCIGRGLSAIRCNENIDLKFLLHFLRSNEKRIADKATGSTFKAITQKDLKVIKIPLPPLPQQKRISAILDKAAELKRHSQAIINKYDELTQSLFLDMFGDPVLNPMGWEVKKLNEIVLRLDTGKSIQSVDEKEGGIYKVLKTSSVSWGEFRSWEAKPLPKDYFPPKEHFIKKGDLLLSRMNTTELVGASTYVHEHVENLALPDRIWKFVWKDQYNIEPIFVWYGMNKKSFRAKISRISSGTSGSMKNISKKKVLGLTFILPPIELQTQFAERVKAIEQQKQAAQESLKKAEDLFNGLLQQAFKGELF